jgi:hypothetical protein
VSRHLPGLLALAMGGVVGGCDIVLQLAEVELPVAPCGPYSSVRPVEIMGVTEARGFSTSPDGELALVFGRIDNGPRRLIPLRPAGDGWEPHPDLQAGLADITQPEGANLAPPEPTPVGDDYVTFPRQPVMMVWSGTPHQLARYFWSGTRWTLDTNVPPIIDGAYDIRAGNVVVVTGGGGVDDIVRHTVQIRLPRDPADPHQVLLSANFPPMFSLVPRPERTRPLNEAQVRATQAVLSENMRTLVYDAADGAGRNIYASARSPANDFSRGGLLEGVNTADLELEPWIDATCSRLYFRRVPAGQPNDPGQIFVAE